MGEGLDRLAGRFGIEPSYISETGEWRVISPEIKTALLQAMGVDALKMSSAEYAPESAPDPLPPTHASGVQRCYSPEWFETNRIWGFSAQLYGLRSSRNAGIGDFEDLARLTEIAAAEGADFIGVNPLHALFLTDPDRCSPYSPSSRRMINPLYIAVDQLIEFSAAEEQDAASLRTAEFLDYAAVARLKLPMLERAFAADHPAGAFDDFVAEGGDDLHEFALFEALSEHHAQSGSGAGWYGWPALHRERRSAAVLQFADANQDRIRYHAWLQWIAACQLERAQYRAKSAGMRIGLYLDLAVGVAPDGAATWADPELVIAGARVGAPPDLFNHKGQDWGLAPMAPRALAERDLAPFAKDISALMAAAGAIRMDHAMGLQRLYWIPNGYDATAGSYVSYPLDAMLDTLAAASQSHRCIVIGEDLGTVPPGFREKLRDRGVQSYRVFYFECDYDGRYREAKDYPADAMACVSTHDLPTLAGWWLERDIAARAGLALYPDDGQTAAEAARTQSRAQLKNLIGSSADLMRDREALSSEHISAIHGYLAGSPARMFAVQLDDVCGVLEQVNLPGTFTEYPNWRRRLNISLEDLAGEKLFSATCEAVRQQRPK